MQIGPRSGHGGGWRASLSCETARNPAGGEGVPPRRSRLVASRRDRGGRRGIRERGFAGADDRRGDRSPETREPAGASPEPRRRTRGRGSPRGPRSIERPRRIQPRPRDGTRRSSPERRTGLFEDLIRGNARCASGFELVEPTLRFLQPEFFGVGVGLLIEAGDESFRQASAFLGREFQRLGLELARGISHDRMLSPAGHCLYRDGPSTALATSSSRYRVSHHESWSCLARRK